MRKQPELGPPYENRWRCSNGHRQKNYNAWSREPLHTKKAASANVYRRDFSDMDSGSNNAAGPTDPRQCPDENTRSKELDDFIETQLGQKSFVGISVALVQGGEMTFCKGYGYASKETKKPVDTETRFAVASITKEFTAASIFLLSEEGKLSVYDPVAKYFPDLTRAQDIRLLDLMNMVSGYRDFYPLDFLTTEMTKPTTPDEVINEYAKRPLDFEPGTRWSYSSTNYSILGRVVEKVSGISYQDFVRERIFTPLGMTHSGFEPDPAGPEAAQGYRSFTVVDSEPAPREGLNWMYSAGSIYTTPADMVKWDVALMNGKILKPESYRLMTTNRLLSNGAATSYCCGLGRKEVKGEAVLWHNGEAAGFSLTYRISSINTVCLVHHCEHQQRFAGRLSRTYGTTPSSCG